MTLAQLIAEIMANVNANGNRENTGARVQALLIEMAQFSDKVNFFDTYADFPAVGQDEMLYVTKDANVVYRYDTALNTYVLLNDPDVVNPDAPEEGQTFYVRLATSAALNACTYNNGTGGVGATLTGNANGLLSQSNQVGKIDNIAPVVNDVLLIKNQATALQNGIYEVTQAGDVSNPFILTRIDGYDESSEVYPSVVFVSLGQNNANKYFTQSTASPVIGTSSLVFSVSTTSTQALPILFFDTVTQGPLDAFDANPATYTSGTAYPATLPGYGATLRGNVNGALGTINGVTMVSGSRIIVKNEANAAYNGTYTVTNAGSATQRWTLTRWVSDSGLFYRTRTFVVNNPNCNDYGSSWSVSSPLSMSNANYGTTPIVFSRINKLSNVLSATADDTSDRMLDTQRIYSEDALGELKMGYDYGAGLETYLYRAQDGNGLARTSIYTDGKGVVLQDDPSDNRMTVYSDGLMWLKTGTSAFPPLVLTPDLVLESYSGGNIQLNAKDAGNIYLTSGGPIISLASYDGVSDAAEITLDYGSNGISITHTTGSGSSSVNVADTGISVTSNEFDISTNADSSEFNFNATQKRIKSEAAPIILTTVVSGDVILDTAGFMYLSGLGVFADDAAAGVGGVPAGALYKTTAGLIAYKL